MAGGGALSASRLRLLHDTTMIDAALDLDEPDAPPGPLGPLGAHPPPAPHVSHHAHHAAPPALALAL